MSQLKVQLNRRARVTSYTMVVAFCDMKGSTKVLRELGAGKFYDVQKMFFGSSSKIIKEANRSFHKSNFPRLLKQEVGISYGDHTRTEFPWARVDKFMGDCTMFYVICGRDSEASNQGKQTVATPVLISGVRMAMTIVSSLVGSLKQAEREFQLGKHGIQLGCRAGLALGSGIRLAYLGTKDRPGHCYTVTGETVNLAARLEHATTPEFLNCINEARSRTESFVSQINDRGHLHGTALGEALINSDRQIIDLYAVCEKTFQIRANDDLVHHLEAGEHAIKLRWRKIPFSPRGFGMTREVCLLGGSSPSDLFRTV